MATIIVYPWSFYNKQQDIREAGKGLITEDTFSKLGEDVADPQIDLSAPREIDDSELTQSGRYRENET